MLQDVGSKLADKLSVLVIDLDLVGWRPKLDIFELINSNFKKKIYILGSVLVCSIVNCLMLRCVCVGKTKRLFIIKKAGLNVGIKTSWYIKLRCC